MTVSVVWAREAIPSGPSVFLAGPTPRSKAVASWRPQAIAALDAAWTAPPTLHILVPENPGRLRETEYDDQIEWEWEGLDRASAILFWIPRDLRTLPGFTTNVEFGFVARSGRAVLGCPPDCPNPERNRYLVRLARRLGVPVTETMVGTVARAVEIISAIDITP
ncbi:nucleoside 2-deoxyribosyltransferase domain-containing protein [Catenulispora rubra]|uniref:nucleoside 2-deoxyribosyltransferase domain-containing protein n=1 Tax=Catenulispora rubra TaxID=280293 RepID=UPI0018928191|nr:nucleoside 2-deoxyribosyltransferase domain-containing protein [Catenulispora rubra]